MVMRRKIEVLRPRVVADDVPRKAPPASNPPPPAKKPAKGGVSAAQGVLAQVWPCCRYSVAIATLITNPVWVLAPPGRILT